VAAEYAIDAVPDAQEFRLLGKDASTGFLRCQCPSCFNYLKFDPKEIATRGQAVSRVLRHRYVATSFGLLIVGLGIYIALTYSEWWADSIAGIFMTLGFLPLGFGLSALLNSKTEAP
jgi:hypothetical protein